MKDISMNININIINSAVSTQHSAYNKTMSNKRK